jgi:outer membrane protein OmpA-like peptidoglycan-associated protein
MMRSIVVVAVVAALAACATPQSAEDETPPFDPASCYTRDFNIYFEGQSTDLSAEARQIMDGMGRAVRGCHIVAVRVTGSTDAQGGAVSNDEVSERRAQVIGEYLAAHVGWPRSRMTVAATGERGAVTDEGLNVPMRRRARVVVEAVAP